MAAQPRAPLVDQAIRRSPRNRTGWRGIASKARSGGNCRCYDQGRALPQDTNRADAGEQGGAPPVDRMARGVSWMRLRPRRYRRSGCSYRTEYFYGADREQQLGRGRGGRRAGRCRRSSLNPARSRAGHHHNLVGQEPSACRTRVGGERHRCGRAPRC